MRKIYDEYFHVPEQGEGVVRETVFFARLIVSIVCMAVCMIAMGYNAYAYFAFNIESTANVLQASTYSFVEPSETEEDIIKMVSSEGSVVATNTKWKYILQPGTYELKLKKEGNASTGYGRIDILSENGENSSVVQSIYTQQIGKVNVEGEEVPERIVTIQVDTITVIQVEACWGTYAGAATEPSTYLADGMAIQSKEGTIAVTDISNLSVATAEMYNIINVML